MNFIPIEQRKLAPVFEHTGMLFIPKSTTKEVKPKKKSSSKSMRAEQKLVTMLVDFKEDIHLEHDRRVLEETILLMFLPKYTTNRYTIM